MSAQSGGGGKNKPRTPPDEFRTLKNIVHVFDRANLDAAALRRIMVYLDERYLEAEPTE